MSKHSLCLDAMIWYLDKSCMFVQSDRHSVLVATMVIVEGTITLWLTSIVALRLVLMRKMVVLR